MAGTLFGLGLSQQIGSDGLPLSGCKLYIYEAGTTTPVSVYQDYALSLTRAWPIEADANGRLPTFWLADGTYRARLTDSGGTVVFDTDNIQALGPSSGSASGATIDPTTIFTTGDLLWNAGSGARTGWVRANGRTIGSASSGAAERANADTQSLYEYLWANFSDSLCPVTTGRGVSAAADFAANKPIAVLDLRGRAPAGVDDMGNSAAGRLDASVVTSGLVTTPGNTGGADRVTLTTNQMPSHSHVATANAVPDHEHLVVGGGQNSNLTSSNYLASSRDYIGTGTPTDFNYAVFGSNTAANVGRSSAAGGHTPSVTNANTGGGAAHTNMPPFMLGTWYLKL